jgi:membrane associated rhomboid family serine protease
LVPNRPQFVTLLTGIFIHVSVAHLFWNMVFLWLFGPHVEEALGWEAFLALYLGGGIAAGLLHMAIILLFAPKVVVPLVGASGAISAVMAPFVIRFHRAQIRLFWLPAVLLRSTWSQLEVPAVMGVGVWMLQNIGGGIFFLINPQPGGTAYWAHIGGFVFGLVAAELTGLLRDGRQDYLLQDARSAGTRGQETLETAIRKYRAFLDRDPRNGVVRAELARLLVVQDRQEAETEMLGAVRDLLKRNQPLLAARCVRDAASLGLPLPLSARERLRLAGALETMGEPDGAVVLLSALISETPDAPEDEMARLKLGQLLRERDRVRANAVLAGFLEKYPHSQWAGRAKELQTNV